MSISVVCSCNSQSKSYRDRKKRGARGDYLVLCCSSALVLIVQQLSNKRSNSFENSNLTTSLKLSMDKFGKKIMLLDWITVWNVIIQMILLITLFGQSHITEGGKTRFYHTVSVQAYKALNCSHPSSELNTVHFGLRSALVAVWGQAASGVKLNFQAAAASTWFSARHWNGPENKQAPQEYGNNNNEYRITETNKGLVGGHLTTQSVHHLCFIEDKYTSEKRCGFCLFKHIIELLCCINRTWLESKECNSAP